MGRNDPLFDTAACRCESCGFPVEGAVALIQQAEDTIDGLSRDLIGKRSRISQLEGENAKDLTRHPRYHDACEVVAYWGKKLAPKARELKSEDRIRPTCARLHSGHTVEGLKLCIDGYAKFPYVVSAKRSATGSDSQLHIEPRTIFANPGKIEAGIRMAREQARKVSLDWRDIRRQNHKTILKALPDAIYDERALLHVASCPRCAAVLRVFDPAGSADTLLHCDGCTMNERTFLAALIIADDPAPAMLDEARRKLAEALVQVEGVAA